MSAHSPLWQLVRNLVVMSPMALAYLAGLIVVIMNWSRAPRPALAAAVSLVVMLLLMPVQTIANMFIGRAGHENLLLILTVVNLFFNLIHAAAFGALLYAVFADRPAAIGGKPIG